MFLVLLLGKDSKIKTALLQLQPCLHTHPSPPSQTRRVRKEEFCPDCLDIILTSEATDVSREVSNPKCAWTARAIRKENRRGKGSSLKG